MNNFTKYASYPSIRLWGSHFLHGTPIVQIVIPTYNHPQYLESTIRSAIDQNFKQNYEILVVDDNPNCDTSLAIVKRINSDKVIYYHNSKNLGLFGNWNRCIELACSKYIVFLHDDDQLLPNNLSILFEIQRLSGDEKTAIFSNVNFINSDGNLIRGIINKELLHKKKLFFLYRRHFKKLSAYNLFLYPQTTGMGCLFNRQCLLELGGYDEHDYPCSDYSYTFLYQLKYGAIKSVIPIALCRISDNTSNSCWKQFAKYNKIIRERHISEIKLPNRLLKLISKALYEEKVNSDYIIWGGTKKV